jgi:hypothetical protein
MLLILNQTDSQPLPDDRRHDWFRAGLNVIPPTNPASVIVTDYGIVGDGKTPNDDAINSLIRNNLINGAVLEFPEGSFLFNKSIELSSNIIIRGMGAGLTKFIFNLSGTGNSINISGTPVLKDTSSIVQRALTGDSCLYISNPDLFSAGDIIQLFKKDSDLVTSDWALNTVGQIVKITAIENNKIVLNSKIRLNYELERNSYIRRIIPAANSGLECFSMERIDNTAPEQSSIIQFSYSVNSWVRGVESKNCTFSHIEAEFSSNLLIHGCYIHDAFEFGGGGRAYGVMLHLMTNECLIENNIFRNLRHSMIVQAGANSNVFAYNYSIEPHWTESQLPVNSSGDIVLHGNYVYGNLFEQNICQNIVIDNSHGPNGPYNTFFRNRAELYGIFFSASNSPNQNFIGNEIPNNSFPYSLINYTILGDGHFLYGNNNKGRIVPTGTEKLDIQSYAYSKKPDFLENIYFGEIGTPYQMGKSTIPAKARYETSDKFNGICKPVNTDFIENNQLNNSIQISPNPASDYIEIMLGVGSEPAPTEDVEIFNILGMEITTPSLSDTPPYQGGEKVRVDISHLLSGVYFVRVGDVVRKFMVVR